MHISYIYGMSERPFLCSPLCNRQKPYPYNYMYVCYIFPPSSQLQPKSAVCVCAYGRFSSSQTGEKGYHRLTPDQPVGLRHAHCYLTLENTIKVLQSGLYDPTPY